MLKIRDIRNCGCGKNHMIPTKYIVVGSARSRQLNESTHFRRIDRAINGTAFKRLNLGKKCLVFSDRNTHRILGERICDCLNQAGYSATGYVIDGCKDISASDVQIAEILKRIKNEYDFLVSVGAGTINDITKYIADKFGKKYVAFPTAPSMNGYTSSISAIEIKGVKRTLPAKPPVAVFADVDVLANSPKEMILAGFGDLVSKFVSNADWKLSQIVRNDYYCDVPGRMVKKLEMIYSKDTDIRDRNTIRKLIEALLVSGFSMVVAGSSSPVSGGEHLISHLLDMTKKKKNLHGIQVAVGTVISSKLYDRILEFDFEQFDVEERIGRWNSFEDRMKEIEIYFSRYGVVGEIKEEFRRKYLTKKQLRERLLFLRKNWKDIKRQIRKVILPSERILKLLKNVGVSTEISSLGIPAQYMREVVYHAREVRNRYTALDLADELGILEDFIKDLR